MLGGRSPETENKRKCQISGLKSGHGRFKKFEQWSLTRGFVKQYLTEKQNGYLKSGRLREVVAMRELTVFYLIQGSEKVNWEISQR